MCNPLYGKWGNTECDQRHSHYYQLNNNMETNTVKASELNLYNFFL